MITTAKPIRILSKVLANTDTITAIATPPGYGGVGIVRVSGPKTRYIIEAISGFLPEPRRAKISKFRNSQGEILDVGVVLFFPGPNSFTGEDIAEFQGHGGPVILNILVRRICELGARLARAGEFSERAFLNNKLDLTQAEAIADLIHAGSEQAARSAMRSLEGEFSRQIQNLLAQLIRLRVYIEAAIDFPEEEIDFLANSKVEQDFNLIQSQLAQLLKQARQGALLQAGLTVVLAGFPNAGKSTLLNQLSGRDSAIVTDIPGTTRDIMREHINLDGLPLHILDTAGLRTSVDVIEQAGIARAKAAIAQADHILLLIDAEHPAQWSDLQAELPHNIPHTIVINKIDKVKSIPNLPNSIAISAQYGTGLTELKTHLKSLAGLSEACETGFIARERHITALEKTQQTLLTHAKPPELLAEDLRTAQQHLNEITGEFTSNDLLGEIFSNFCIGK